MTDDGGLMFDRGWGLVVLRLEISGIRSRGNIGCCEINYHGLIPWVHNGYFDPLRNDYFTQLKIFMVHNSRFKIELHLNACYPSSGYNQTVTKHQAHKLEELFAQDPRLTDIYYSIIPHGDTIKVAHIDSNLVFGRQPKSSEIIKTINARIEIVLLPQNEN